MKKALSIILLLLLVVFIYFMFIRQNELVVKIDNDSDKDISGLQLVTNQSIFLGDLNTIKAGKKENFTVELPEDFVEGAISLSYTDKLGKKHNEIIFGYVERGYVGNGEVRIHSVDKDGALEMTIEDKSDIF